MTRAQKIAIIKENITIADYFEKMIYPQMKGYYALYDCTFDSKDVTLCPLHNEDTPSFRWYRETSSYYCFGCKHGGDVIRLHRDFMEIGMSTPVTFDGAVEFLYNTFLRGREQDIYQPQQPRQPQAPVQAQAQQPQGVQLQSEQIVVPQETSTRNIALARFAELYNEANECVKSTKLVAAEKCLWYNRIDNIRVVALTTERVEESISELREVRVELRKQIAQQLREAVKGKLQK